MRLGVFQADCGGLGLDERLSRLEGALKGQTLDLMVCPELFAPGTTFHNIINDLIFEN